MEGVCSHPLEGSSIPSLPYNERSKELLKTKNWLPRKTELISFGGIWCIRLVVEEEKEEEEDEGSLEVI